MTTIHLLHISDLHVCQKDEQSIRRNLKAMADRLATEGVEPSFLVISGDIALKGKKEEYDSATRVLGELMVSLGIENDHLVIAPGNHDVDRGAIHEFLEAGYLSKLTNVDAADRVYGDDGARSEALQRQNQYWEWATSLSSVSTPTIVEHDGVQLGFAPLNSAWRCASDQDRGRLFLSRSQLDDAAASVSDADFRIAVLHHPVAWLHDTEHQYVRTTFATSFDIICSGHTHVNDGAHISRPAGDTYFSCAKAIHDPTIPIGFTVLELEAESRRLQAHHWLIHRTSGRVGRDTEIADDGRHVVTLAPVHPSGLERRASRNSLVSHSEKVVQMQEAQVRAVAPSVLGKAGLEILPPSVREKVTSTGKRVGRLLDPELLINKGGRWRIDGPPLSGKSTLLRYLFERAQELGSQPLLVNFEQLPQDGKVTKVVAAIAKATGVSSNNLKQLFKSHSVLLVDNAPAGDSSRFEGLTALGSQYGELSMVMVENGNPLSSQSSESAPETQLVGWRMVEVTPVPLRSIQRLVDRLVDGGHLATSNRSQIAASVARAFGGDLPRLPWVVLMYIELLLEGQAHDSRTLTAVLGKFVALQLGRFAVTPKRGLSAECTRALQVVARESFDRRKVWLPQTEVAERLRTEFEDSALPVFADEVVRVLSDAALLSIDELTECVGFRFPALLDFCQANHLIENPDSILPLSLERLEVEAGALAHVASTGRRDELCQGAFDVVTSSVSELRTTFDAELAAQLDKTIALKRDVFEEEFSGDELPVDEVDDAHAMVAHAKQGAGDRRFDAPPKATSGLSVQGLIGALSILQSGVFLSAATKRSAVGTSVSLIITLLHDLYDIRKEVYAALVREHGYPNVDDEELVNSTIILIGNSVLASNGAGAHLAPTILQELSDETDEFRRFILLVWLTALPGGYTHEDLQKHLAATKSAAVLKALRLWCFLAHMMQSTLEGRSDSFSRATLRLVVERLVGVETAHIRGFGRKGAQKTAINDHMRALDQAVERNMEKPTKSD